MSIIIPHQTIQVIKLLAEFKDVPSAEVRDRLKERIDLVREIYDNNGTLLIWRPLDRFALGMIAKNGSVTDERFMKAMSSLERCEKAFDSLTAERQKGLGLIYDHLFDLLDTSDRHEFNELMQRFQTKDIDKIYTLQLLQNFTVLSSIDKTLFANEVLEQIWGDINTDGKLEEKHLKRITHLSKQINALPENDK